MITQQHVSVSVYFSVGNYTDLSVAATRCPCGVQPWNRARRARHVERRSRHTGAPTRRRLDDTRDTTNIHDPARNGIPKFSGTQPVSFVARETNQTLVLPPAVVVRRSGEVGRCAARVVSSGRPWRRGGDAVLSASSLRRTLWIRSSASHGGFN
jgi:hypothetical protein